MQKLRRDQAAVGHNNHDIGGQLPDDVIRGAVPQGAGLVDRDAMLDSQLLDRRCGQYLLAAYRLITAGEYSANLMPGVQRPLLESVGQSGGGAVPVCTAGHHDDFHVISLRNSKNLICPFDYTTLSAP